MSFLRQPGPRWFNIDAGRPFLEELARGLTETLVPLGADALAAAMVLIPTRRAGRDLAEAFLAASGGRAVLLPQMRALGDLDEGEPPFEPGELALDLPPAIPAARRRYELARLVADHEQILGRRLGAVAALDLADAMAGFLDSVEIEEAAPLGALADLVPEALAAHWQVSADFLRLALAEWPARLAAMGLMDVGARRVLLLRRLAERWRETPPEQVIVAAGSTGSAPAVANLLATIADLPHGCVVLPGLDLHLAESAWAEVGEQHPQGGLKRLLAGAGVDRGEVRPWTAAPDARGRWRRRLINEALRPAEATADWLAQIKRLRDEGASEGVDPIAEGLRGLSAITARAEEEAATAAALLLRAALETPGRTAALVTPDAALARRVSARLTRWGVSADSSAGAALAGYPVATLMGLVARAVLDPLDPVTLLAIAKHRFVRFGLAEDELASARLALERALRGPRQPGWAEIAARTQSPGALRLLELLEGFASHLAAPFADGPCRPTDAAQALAEVIEGLALGPDSGLGDLWSGLAGEAAAGLLAGLIGESDGLPPVRPAGFVELVDQLIAREVVRGGGASHPRLRILGAIEARLARADLLVLAGLEEGVWPQAAPADPFLSRPMRSALGLPPPERRLGLAAHDFAQGASAPEVVLIAAERREGAPAVASRWLWRLETLVKGAGLALPTRPDILAAARALDAPAEFAPAARPRPRPPVAVRPRALSVTRIETWIRDPYAIYARYVLGLRRLDLPAEPVEALARGTAVHRAFERYAKEHPGAPDESHVAIFASLLIESLAEAGVPPHRLARERALAINVAPWVVALEGKRRAGARLAIEESGSHSFEAPGGAFTVTAKADRIEARGRIADILDFKTGAPPSAKQVSSGLAPQLTLTAAILARGGFPEVGPAAPGDLVYIRVSGGRIPGREEVRAAPPESLDFAERALQGLKRRVAAFDDPATPYVSWAAPQFIGRYGGDYDHLARYWEWGVIGGDEEGGE
ncbi:MAG TPA: double-strand break repair protein AddB [Caulobacteraceae bacterium]|nr:double-strand break repair protein AddB [Caulobacteraceae bacterium]